MNAYYPYSISDFLKAEQAHQAELKATLAAWKVRRAEIQAMLDAIKARRENAERTRC